MFISQLTVLHVFGMNCYIWHMKQLEEALALQRKEEEVISCDCLYQIW